MDNSPLYHERLTSNKTEALFLALTILFLVLCSWRLNINGIDTWAVVFLLFSIIFLFYSVNYRTLIIHLEPQALKLKFGLFTWTVALSNIESGALDEVPTLLRLGGAGIHFMIVRKRYRTSFNFLEYPRVAIAFKQATGPVQDIFFSTQRPEEILRLIQTALKK